MLTKILYGITALILALAIGGAAVQTYRLSKAENRAVEATKLAEVYQGSLESLERAVEAQAKSDRATLESLENRAKKAEQLASKAQKENHALKQALEANRDWDIEPIPAGLLNALRN